MTVGKPPSFPPILDVFLPWMTKGSVNRKVLVPHSLNEAKVKFTPDLLYLLLLILLFPHDNLTSNFIQSSCVCTREEVTPLEKHYWQVIYDQDEMK